ncbi:phosphatidylglycerophosphatase A [Aquicoccus sp. SCR17]|nr:phosphatidylglycerophosphatase A [Carideicomes alvinocaridis]
MSRLIATFFYLGFLKPAPGTWASLAALPLAWALHLVGGPWLLSVAALVALVSGFYATTAYVRGRTDHDPKEVVIDEVTGQWIALLPVSYGAAAMGADVLRLWPGWVAAFLLFRLFDIWKPGPIGRADRLETPYGVMFDDALAGVFAALATLVLAGLGHGVLMR